MVILKQDRWENNGQRFSKVVIVAENVELVGSKNNSNNSNNANNSFTQNNKQQNRYNDANQVAQAFSNVQDNFSNSLDIPF